MSAATAQQLSGLLKGELQAGLLVPSAREPVIAVEILRREPFFIAFPNGHTLETSARLTLDDIRSEPVIWFARDLNSAFQDRFLATCAEAGYAPKVVQAVTTTLECLQFVAQGLGISFATRSLAATGFEGISFREFDDT